MLLVDRPLTAAEARAITQWRYPAPYDVYDLTDGDVDLLLHRTADGEGYRPAVDAAGSLVGFVVFGPEARVSGQQASPVVADLGAGVRPDLVSQGLGGSLLGQAVVLAVETWQPAALRTAVAAFNTRSLALCRRCGFQPVRDFTGPGGRPFRELELRWHEQDGAAGPAEPP